MVRSNGQGRRRAGLFGGGLLALAVLLAAAGTWFSVSRPAPVHRIALLSKPGIGVVLDDPDLYLVVRDSEGRTWTSSTVSNAVIGDGLWFKVPLIEVGNDTGFDPARIDEVEVWDENAVFANAMLDRFRISGGSGGGQKYRVELERSTDMRRWLPWALLLGAVPTGIVGVIVTASAVRGTGARSAAAGSRVPAG